MSQYFYITREHNAVPCSLVNETAYKRTISLSKDGESKNVQVHPKGVAWGKFYPRLFMLKDAPTKVFVHKGRVIVGKNHAGDMKAVPLVNTHYRFQPFLSDVIDSIHAKENVLLTGGTGVGKTTHIEQLAAQIGQPILRINFNGETRMSDLIGKMNVLGGETRWVDGVLPMAMRLGYWLLLDELDFADPAVLSLLHPVLEDRPTLTLKENSGEIIRPHPDFRLFATANSIGAMSDRSSSYTGVNVMNEAFLDRWQVLFVQNLPQKEEMKVVKGEVPGLRARWIKKIVMFANEARVNASEIGFSGDNFSTRKVLAWSKKTALHASPIEGAKKAWLGKLPESEQEGILRILGTHFGVRGKTSSSRTLKSRRPKSVGTKALSPNNSTKVFAP